MVNKEDHAIALLRAITGHVQESLPLFPVLSENFPYALLSEDTDGKLNFFNRAAERLFGYSQIEAIGMDSVLLVPPELREGREKLFHEVLEAKVSRYVETARITKSGERINITGFVFPYVLGRGVYSIAAMVAPARTH
jgi:PAS domain S-box-containing protein